MLGLGHRPGRPDTRIRAVGSALVGGRSDCATQGRVNSRSRRRAPYRKATAATLCSDEKPHAVDGCHALKSSGEPVRLHFPKWYRPGP